MGKQMINKYSFLEGKTCFVTGHTGFKGSWLCHILSKFGANVVGFALEPEKNSHFQLANTDKVCTSLTGDLENWRLLSTTIQDAEPDFIIPLAAQPRVSAGYKAPLRTVTTNVVGTANVLMAAHELRKKPIVAIITSDKCYENREDGIPLIESDRMGGQDPYSASKGATEIISSSLARSFLVPAGISTVMLRGGNVIGGGDFAENRLVPDIISAVRTGQDFHVRSPTAVRPWQYILDVLNGYLAAIRWLCSQPNGTFDCYNIGPLNKNEASVKEVLDSTLYYWGNNETKILNATNQEYAEAKTLRLNISKAREHLDWEPEMNFNETIKATVNWYKKLDLGEQAMDLTSADIKQFFRLG
jgi:CDP-glucose 4,6-dehydratase